MRKIATKPAKLTVVVFIRFVSRIIRHRTLIRDQTAAITAHHQQTFIHHIAQPSCIRTMDMDYRKDEVPLVMEDTKNDNVNHQQNDSPSIKHTALCEAPCVSMLRHIDSDSARMEPSTQSTIAHHAATPFAGSLSSTVSSSSVTANGCLSQTTSQSTSLTNSPPQQVCRGLKINVDSTAVPTNTDQQQDQDEMVHVSSKHVQDNNGDVAIPQSTPTPVFVDPTIALELNGDEVVRSNSAVSVSNVNATKTPNSDSPESVASSATPDALSQWTESPTESATTTPAAPTKKKSKSRNRYRPMRTLQDSLFGQVQVRKTNKNAFIATSRINLLH